MAKKKITLTKLKKKYWDLFSLMIKLTYSEDGENTRCFTCDAPLKIGTSNCQGGHYYTKKGYPALYFDRNNVRVQCYHCNINLSGNTVIFGERLLTEVGEEVMQDLALRRHNMVKRTQSDYNEMIANIKEEIETLK